MTVEEAQALLSERSNQAVRMLALEALSRIVLRTPVDTGRARGNWQAGAGSPDATVNPVGFDKQGTATIARGAAILQAAEPDQTLYITNSLAYILPLEAGHSGQAPAGMVGVTIAELQPLATEIAAKIRTGGFVAPGFGVFE